jgi:hypothetical protein
VSYPSWEEEEHDLRRTEVRALGSASVAQKRGSRWQFGAVVAAFISVLLSTLVAWRAAQLGQQAAKSNENSSAQQADQYQISTAINAIAAAQPASRIAGLILLERNAADQVGSPLPVPAGNREAYDTYATAIEVLGGYIHANSLLSPDSAATAGTAGPGSAATAGAAGNVPQGSFGLGYGTVSSSRVPLDVIYAADQIKALLAMRSLVMTRGGGDRPAIDLSNDELSGQSWAGIRFDWLSTAWMPGIDLRGANLAGARFGKDAYLLHAYLQCADLRGANFRGSSLINADLRGANVNRADFSGAKLRGAKLNGVVGTAKGLPPGAPEASWSQSSCNRNRTYWDNVPSAAAH